MNEKNLVICGGALQYANSLAGNIAERMELNVRTYICTTWDKLLHLFKEKKIHILIIDEEYGSKKRDGIIAEQIFVLTGNVSISLGENEKAIYKYQCADQILAEVFDVYCENSQDDVYRILKKNGQKRIAVYSPIHRSGKTRFAIALGKELSKKEQTLYLNLEEYAGLEGRFANAEGNNLGDLIYYAKQENSNFALRLSAMTRVEDSLKYILPIPLSSDLKEITLEEWKLLLQKIEEKTSYETIVMDVGECVQGLLELLTLCDKVYMPILEDDISKAKLRQYEENVEKLNMEQLASKTHQLLVSKDVETYVKRMRKEGN